MTWLPLSHLVWHSHGLTSAGGRKHCSLHLDRRYKLSPSHSALHRGPPNLKIHNGEEQPAAEMTTLAFTLTVRFFLPFLPCFLLLLRVGLEQATAHVQRRTALWRRSSSTFARVPILVWVLAIRLGSSGMRTTPFAQQATLPDPCFFTVSQKGLLSYLVLPFFQPLKNLNFFWARADPLISLS